MRNFKIFLKEHPVLIYLYICIVCLAMLLGFTGKYGVDFLVA